MSVRTFQMAKIGIETVGSCDTEIRGGFDQSHSLQDKARLKFNMITNM